MLALLYDVHGNLAALDAVLGDCPAERFLLGGDYALGGPWPAETIDRLDELDARWIRGNTDRWLVDESDAPEATPSSSASPGFRMSSPRTARCSATPRPAPTCSAFRVSRASRTRS
jgi:hypothetical protein